LNDVNEDGDNVLALACSNGYTDLVRLLLTTIPNVDIDDRGTKQDCTPLMEGEKNKSKREKKNFSFEF
jgi:ankyrin repeat protein